MEIVAVAVTLFFIMDPLGNIPLFLSVLSQVPEARRQKVLVRELLIAYAIMCVFLFFGSQLLKILGLSQEAVGIGGAIVLFIIAIRMIFPSRGGQIFGSGDDESDEPLIVPLAVPLFAGPSLLASLLLLVQNKAHSIWYWFAAMTCAWFVASFILFCSPLFFKLLGNRGLKAIERLIGMILISIAVQMLLNSAIHIKALF